MAEVLDQEPKTENKPAEQPAAESVSTEAAPAGGAGFSDIPAQPKGKKKKNRKRLIKRIVIVAVLAAAAAGGYFLWRQNQNQPETAEVLTDVVSRGSIVSKVEGSGAAVAKNSASISLLADGTVLEINVSEGDYVHEGDPLYTIENQDVRDRVKKAEKRLRDAQKDYDKSLKHATDPNVRAEFTGILTDVQDEVCKVGEKIYKNQTVATLVDNTRLKLPLYFSYAYEDVIYVGQDATVSVPATMAQLPGTVYEINKVQRVSPEGSRLFEVVIAVDNPGTLTGKSGEGDKAEEMTATATIDMDGETIYPYEPGAFEWFRTKILKSEIEEGEVAWNNLHNYMPVQEGESILTMSSESSEDDVLRAKEELRDKEKKMENAQKKLDSLIGVAPIDGTVLTIGITAGEEAKMSTVAVSIADTTTMIINAQIDEMNVSYAKAGMPVTLKLWENELIGTIDSVSLSAKAENGVARFPMVISVDNADGMIMTGAYVDYEFTASQSDDCLVVPIQSVKSAQTVDGGNCKVLFVQTDVPPENETEINTGAMDIPEGFYPVVVETGISDNHNVEIKSGVEEGATVYSGVVSNDSGMGMFF